MSAREETPLVSPTSSVRETIAAIDRHGKGIVLVVDGARRLLGTVTDGDIRRAMLAGIDLETPVEQLLARQPASRDGRPFPLCAPPSTPPAELVALMQATKLRHIPLVDSDGVVQGLVLLDDLIKAEGLPLRAVVMAGGLGTRLAPLTDETPKPMLPVGDRPLLERIIGQLRDAGITRVNLTTHYRAEDIIRHFGDGAELGVDLEYVTEDTPLGTAGSLGLLEHDDTPLLVMNGDIVTRIDFAALHRFHDEHEADMTVAVRPYELQVPYGVIETDGEVVSGITEKPLVRWFVNAGIYLLNADVSGLVPNGEHYDMTDLIARLVRDGRRVVSFPLREYWLDIGSLSEYEQALRDVSAGGI